MRKPRYHQKQLTEAEMDIFFLNHPRVDDVHHKAKQLISSNCKNASHSHIPLNYRGISFLSMTEKIHTAGCSNNWFSYLEMTNLLANGQHELRPNQSCLQKFCHFTT